MKEAKPMEISPEQEQEFQLSAVAQFAINFSKKMMKKFATIVISQANTEVPRV